MTALVQWTWMDFIPTCWAACDETELHHRKTVSENMKTYFNNMKAFNAINIFIIHGIYFPWINFSLLLQEIISDWLRNPAKRTLTCNPIYCTRLTKKWLVQPWLTAEYVVIWNMNKLDYIYELSGAQCFWL